MNMEKNIVENKNVVLVCVIIGKLYNSKEHLSMGYLAKVLRNEGYSVNVIYTVLSDDTEAIAEKILQSNPFFVGFTAYAMTINRVLSICKLIKDRSPETHITLGGPTPTFEYESILTNNPFIDTIVRGEGEETCKELVNKLFRKECIEQIQGISFYKDGSVRSNKCRPLIKNLNELPWADRDIAQLTKPEYFIIETSRGCLGKCSFCTAANKDYYNGVIWRGRDMDNVVSEIEYLQKTYGVNAFNIIDASFEDPGLMGKKRVKYFAEKIIERKLKISFMVHFRSESIKEKDLPLIDLLIDAGLERVSLGLESGYAPTLKLFNKYATVEDNKTIVKLLKSRYLGLVTGFIMFQPYAVLDELKENTAFLNELNIACRFENFEQHIEIYPGMPLKQKMLEDKLIPEDFDYRYNECDYRYVDRRIEDFASVIGNIARDHDLEFELFDIQLDVFHLRLRKKAQKESMISLIDIFYENVEAVRKDLGNTISCYFLKEIEKIEKGTWKIEECKNLLIPHVVNPTNQAKRKIRKLQLDLMRDLKTLGLDFREIAH